MKYILKKEYENISVDSINKPLGELSQKEIKSLKGNIVSKFFTQETLKKKKIKDIESI